MKRFYFEAGEFNNTSSGIFSFNYDINEIGLIVDANTFPEARDMAIIFFEKHFNKPHESVDVWYGYKQYPWEYMALTEFFFDRNLDKGKYNNVYYV